MHDFRKTLTSLSYLLLASALLAGSAAAQDRRDKDRDKDRGRNDARWDVEVARYGVPGQFVDVTRRIQMARGGDELDFPVSNETLGGDPAPNVPKRLDVLFQIGDRHIAVSVPEGDRLHTPRMIRRILAASYHAHDMEPRAVCREACANVTDIVASRLRDGILEIPVRNEELGGDPVPNVQKTLTVRFLVGRDEEREVSADENSLLRLPENAGDNPDLVRDLREFRDHQHDRDRDRH